MVAVMSVQVAHELSLITQDCCNCGVVFAMPESLYKRARESDQVWFFCPNGHQQHFTRTEIQRLRDKLDEQTREATRQSERALQAEKQAEAIRIKLSNLKKRIKNGVCPCCKRSFQDVVRHIATKHPEYAA